MSLIDEHRYDPPRPEWGSPEQALLRRRRLRESVDGPFRKAGWLSRLMRALGKLVGAQAVLLALLGGCRRPRSEVVRLADGTCVQFVAVPADGCQRSGPDLIAERVSCGLLPPSEAKR